MLLAAFLTTLLVPHQLLQWSHPVPLGPPGGGPPGPPPPSHGLPKFFEIYLTVGDTTIVLYYSVTKLRV